MGEQRTALTLLLILCYLMVVLSNVETIRASSEMWSQTYGGEDTDSAESVIQTSDGGYAIVGRTESFGGGLSSFWLVKTDEFGKMEWRRAYGGKSEIAYCLVEADGGGYAIVGQTQAFGAGFVDVWFVKTDAYGNMKWNKTYGGIDGDSGRSLLVTSDGGYAIAGHTFVAGSYDFWLIKTDEFGNMEWNRTYGDGAASALVETSDGGFALAGGARLVKTDAYGYMEWNQTYEGSIRSLVATSDGGYALAGYIESFGTGSRDFWLVKTDSLGNLQWSRTYKQEGNDYAEALVESSNGGYVLVGIKNFVNSFLLTWEEGSFFLIKTDSAGNMEWNMTYGGDSVAWAKSVVATSDGGYAIAGEKNGDFWLVKTDEYGVVPEFPSWIIIPLVLTITLFSVVVKRKLHRAKVS
jgi:hypothetical protein